MWLTKDENFIENLSEELRNSPIVDDLYENKSLLKQIDLFLINSNLDKTQQRKLLDLMDDVYEEGR
jgi:hypothetical protein